MVDESDCEPSAPYTHRSPRAQPIDATGTYHWETPLFFRSITTGQHRQLRHGATLFNGRRLRPASLVAGVLIGWQESRQRGKTTPGSLLHCQRCADTPSSLGTGEADCIWHGARGNAAADTALATLPTTDEALQ